MRRGLGLVLALGLLVGGAAACSDDDGGTSSAAEDGGTTGDASAASTGDPEVDAYCAAVDEYREAVDAQLANPQDLEAQQRAIDLSEDLAAKLQAAGDPTQLDPEVASQLEECLIRAAEG